MQNRMSWSTFDTVRKSLALEGSSRKREVPDRTASEPKRLKYRYDCIADKEMLLQKATRWSPLEEVQWSDLAKEHRVTKPNGGQIVKLFLSEHDVPAAKVHNRPVEGK